MKNFPGIALLILALCVNQASAATYSGVEPIGEYGINDIVGIQAQDLDYDNSKEIIVYTRSMVYVFSSGITLKWTYGIDNLKAIYVSDIDNDQNKEIIAVSGEIVNNMEWGNMFILDIDGTVLHAYDRKSGESYPHILFYSIVSIDSDSNGYEEIIGASSNGVHSLKDTYDRIIWTARTDERIKEVVINRIDAKNKGILARSDTNLYSFTLDGTLRKKFNISAGIKKMAVLELGPTKDDYIAIVRDDDQLTILDLDFNVRFEAGIIGNIVELSAYDINDDGLNEVILGTKNGIYMLNGRYMITNKYVTGEPVSGVYYLDWEGNGEKELIFASGEYIYAVSKTGELEEKTGTGFHITGLIAEDSGKEDKIDLIAHSNERLSAYAKKKETQTESDARNSYLSAVGFLEMGRYGEAERSAQEALGIYVKTGDTANINACQTLISKISAEKKKEKTEAAEKDYQEAESYFLAQDYALARQYANKASREYMELEDLEGVSKSGELSNRINAVSSEDANQENIREILDSAKKINVFPILSVFLLIAIVLMLALLIGKKNEKQ
ncbi:MAG: hypothetical protein WAX07_02085 [Candidatus Altiarchaeia archaeon]